MSEIISQEYSKLLQEITYQIQTSSKDAKKGVLKEMQKIGIPKEHYYDFLGFGDYGAVTGRVGDDRGWLKACIN